MRFFRCPLAPARGPLELLLQGEGNRDDDAGAATLRRVEVRALYAPHEAAHDFVAQTRSARGRRRNDLAVRADLRRDLHGPLQVGIRGEAAVVASAKARLHPGHDALRVGDLAAADLGRADVGVARRTFHDGRLTRASGRTGRGRADGPETAAARAGSQHAAAAA